MLMMPQIINSNSLDNLHTQPKSRNILPLPAPSMADHRPMNKSIETSELNKTMMAKTGKSLQPFRTTYHVTKSKDQNDTSKYNQIYMKKLYNVQPPKIISRFSERKNKKAFVSLKQMQN